MKRRFLVMFVVLFSLFMITSIGVDAATITITRGENETGVVLCSLESTEYYIQTSEDENPIGYVVCKINGADEIIGTCEVIVIDSQNPSGYVLCSDEIDSSCGSLTIIITNELTGVGYVSSVTGDLGYMLGLNSNIKLE